MDRTPEDVTVLLSSLPAMDLRDGRTYRPGLGLDIGNKKMNESKFNIRQEAKAQVYATR